MIHRAKNFVAAILAPNLQSLDNDKLHVYHLSTVFTLLSLAEGRGRESDFFQSLLCGLI